MDDPHPGIPHEVVMAEVLAIINAQIEAQRKAADASGDLEPRFMHDSNTPKACTGVS